MRKLVLIIVILMFLALKSNLTEEQVIHVKELAETIVVDEEVEIEEIPNRVICIDPGHQQQGDYDLEAIGPGSDLMKAKVSNGTKGVVTGIHEYELTLMMANKLKLALEEVGYTVYLTRSSHDVNISNRERAEIAHKVQADLFIRLHADEGNTPDHQGITILCPSVDNEFTHHIFHASDRLANIMLLEMIETTNATSNGIVYRDDISGFNWSQVPVILIELGFMSHVIEDELLSSSVYQDKLVKGMVNGILTYYLEE